MSAFGSGFSVLAWVKDNSPLLVDLTGVARERVERDLLTDFCTLLNFRWTMDVNITNLEGQLYAFGVNPRITASDRTIRAAVGELANHIDCLRGTISASAEDLARYRLCKQKWKVPDVASDTGSGWGQLERAETSQASKRARF